MPFPKQEKHDFTVAKISTMKPNQAGVYGIFNHSHCLYIGRADDIRKSLLEHVNRESQQAPCIFENDPQYWVAMVIHRTQLSLWERVLMKEFHPSLCA